MVLKLSDLVKKSIDKGYGTVSQTSEKPWSQGNLSMIDLKTGSNPFIKNAPAADISQAKPIQAVHEVVAQEQPVLHSSSASLTKYHSSDATPKNPDCMAGSRTTTDTKWWEKINVQGADGSVRGRVLVNYSLLEKEYS